MLNFVKLVRLYPGIKEDLDDLRGLKENVIVGRLIPAGFVTTEIVAGMIRVCGL
ncbi:hypothetical protein THIOM_002830 [Candidatus Thiomargarita nelsonii]|uniref:DNA-directed RNA polymerase subunit beta n=1 Tax=Candidatus Thiomargarita nelsonii TaxID=1003181 RepID=A0A176S0B9_9GAMM|nr:hypothetical protein THIOM_002830 [Candidatus Thiomargarita nelsonii]